jgi:hypothetical protein
VNDANAQDPLTEYGGIPLIIYPERDANRLIDPLNYIQMKEMGVFGVLGGNVLPDFLDEFETRGLKVLPWYKSGDEFHNRIYNYTDAHYTVWEAEGTDPLEGKVTLYHSEHTSISPDGKSVKAEGPNVPDGDTIILGPGYPQNITYRISTMPVEYTAEYRMKIEQRNTPPSGYLDDVVCTLLITASNAALTEDTIVASREITVEEFNGWNNYDTLNINYELTDLSEDYLQRIVSVNTSSSQFNAHCIQFKVIWAGLDYLNLYVDKIRVYDNKGLELVEEPGPASLIAGLVNTYINHSLGETIISWYGIDEPPSIDNYEPFRVVDSIVADVSDNHLRLHTGFPIGNISGTFSIWQYIDTFAFNKYKDVEFWLRAKPKNMQMNLYNYHYPYSPDETLPNYNSLWQTENIKYITDNLGRINDYDSSFSHSTQSGKFYLGASGIGPSSILPTPSQINYHVNLGLMYGAKELRLDPFFSNLEGNIGLINPLEQTTENYDFFRFTLIPRLNGTFGKTLRSIHQTGQYPKISADSSYNFIDNFSGNLECLPAIANYDLGFFTDQLVRDYFMIVSRYYNEAGVCPIYANLDETHFDFINLSLTKYIADTTYTVINEDVSIRISLPPGEAELFRIVPVVKHGGTLITDDVAGEGITLRGDMIIDNGATLSIYGTYTARGNITIKNGSIINGENGKIIFEDGKKLIINGIAAINGTEQNKLIFDFEPPGSGEVEYGIVINPTASLNISYCEINDASTGILSEVNANYLGAEYVDFNDCSGTSITILGQQSGD